MTKVFSYSSYTCVIDVTIERISKNGPECTFLKGVIRFFQIFDIFDFWLLTSYEITFQMHKTYCLRQNKNVKKIMLIKFDKSIFIQFLHMCNWHKNRKNFEKRSRKHFFKGVISFCQNCQNLKIWLLGLDLRYSKPMKK